MRVISGEKRGLNLLTLEGLNTRPTLDRVKETMFNVINFDLVSKNCLDVFSGSGGLSIEALSRGSELSYLIEHNNDAYDIINKNIIKANYEDKTKLFKLDYKQALEKISNENIKFSIVFLDPPYNSDFYENTLELLIKFDLLNDDAIVICEHKKDVKINTEDFYVWKEKSFSKNCLTFFQIFSCIFYLY